jgi:ATP-dependent DNA helicase RecG
MILEREPQTQFEEIGTVQFVATFKRKSHEDSPPVNVGETSEKTTQKTTQKTTHKILELIVSNPQISRVELAAAIGISADGIKYHLDRLRKQGVLKHVGPDKGGYWEIVKE